MTLELGVRLALDRFELRASFATCARVTGVFGASGSGKTSLLEVVAGLRAGARGAVRFDGDTWLDDATRTKVPPERRGIGYVPQDGLLFPHLTVRENLRAGHARATTSPGAATLDEAARLLELGPLLERRAPTLSGGERQRVALGRALCSGARLLLLDEPFASLDLPLRRRLLPFLVALRDRFPAPILFVSHDPTEIQAVCEDLVVLREGAVIAQGPPRTVLTDPDVFPLAHPQGYPNVFEGTIVEQREATSVVRLGSEERHVDLVTVRVDAAVGSRVLLGLPATEVVLATERPHGLSARNVFPARVTALRSTGSVGLVELQPACATPPWTVEVTETTPAALGLEVGREVHLVVKATSCHVWGGGVAGR